MTDTNEASAPGSGYGALADRLGMQVLELTAERAVATMPVEGNTQALGLLNGGASAALAETIGSRAAATHAAPDRIAVGIELNITHHRAVRTGHVRATATALHLGGSVATYSIDITDDDGHHVATARLTCVIRAKPPAR